MRSKALVVLVIKHDVSEHIYLCNQLGSKAKGQAPMSGKNLIPAN
jgi:hypothetical protein